MKQQSEKYWEMYWQRGHLTSFGEAFSNNYTGVLKDLWTDFFNAAKLGSSIIDIGTGAGSLIEIALNTSTEFTQLIGIDSAKVTPPELILNSNNAKILDATNANSIPLANHSFDYAISQFGIEYSDLSLSMAELSRLLVSGGVFQFVVHDTNSIVLQSNKPSIQAASMLLQRGSSLDVLQDLVEHLQTHGKQSPKTENIRNKFNKSIDKLLTAGKQAVYDTNFPLLMKNVMNQNNYPVADQMIDSFKTELYGQHSRLKELDAAAFDDKKYKQLEQLCSLLNLNLDSRTAVNDDNNRLLAYKLVGSKCT